MPEVIRAFALCALAGLAKNGGGWLGWQWLRDSRPWPFALLVRWCFHAGGRAAVRVLA